MACKCCMSPNQATFPAEMNVHFPGFEGLNRATVWVFPSLLVCLDCGFTEFTIPRTQIQELSDSDFLAQSKKAAA